MKNEAESQAVFAVSYVHNVRGPAMLPDLTVVLLWFSVACFWCQSFCDVSPYVCSYYFSSVLVALWEIAAHSVNHMFSFVF